MIQTITQLKRRRYLYIDPILTDTHLVDVVREYKKLRQLQYDFEWDENSQQAEIYKAKANYYHTLVQKGILFDPLF